MRQVVVARLASLVEADSASLLLQSHRQMTPGDVFVVETPGGGGFGTPEE